MTPTTEQDTDQGGRVAATTSARGRRSERARRGWSRPHGYANLTTPITAALWIVGLGSLITTTGIPTVWVAGLAAVVLLVAPVMTNLHFKLQPIPMPTAAARGGLYAALVTVAAGSWLTWISVIGLYTRHRVHWPAVGVLVTLLILLGPWYGLLRGHKIALVEKQHEKERQQRATAAQDTWAAIFAAAGFPDMVVWDKLDNLSGFQIVLQLGDDNKYTQDDIKAGTQSLITAASHRLRHQGITLGRNSITVEPWDDDATMITVHVRTKNPLKTVLPPQGIGEPASVTAGVWIGLYEDGMKILLPLLGAHTKIVGGTGSGKSGLVNQIITQVSRCSDAVVWVGGVRKLPGLVWPWLDRWWRHLIAFPIFDRVGGTRFERVMEMLWDAKTLIDVRQNLPRDAEQREPTSAMPLLLVILDEASAILRDKRLWEAPDGSMWTASQLCAWITEAGRSELVHLLRVHQDALYGTGGDQGSEMERNTTNRICLRTEVAQDGPATLGSTFRQDTTRLTDHNMYLRLAGATSRVLKGKSFYTPETETKAQQLGTTITIGKVTELHAQLCGELDVPSASALPFYSGRWSAAALPELHALAGRYGVATLEAPNTAPGDDGGPIRDEANNLFGAAPRLADTMREALRGRGVKSTQHGDQPSDLAGDGRDGTEPGIDTDTEFHRIVQVEFPDAEAPEEDDEDEGGCVPEPLATIVARLTDHDEDFIKDSTAAGWVGLSAAELKRTLEADPFRLPRQRPRVSSGPRPRGWWSTDLRAAADRLRLQ